MIQILSHKFIVTIPGRTPDGELTIPGITPDGELTIPGRTPDGEWVLKDLFFTIVTEEQLWLNAPPNINNGFWALTTNLVSTSPVL